MQRHTLDALAGLYLSSASRGPKAPRRLRLDSDGVSVDLTVPGPGALVGVPDLLPVPATAYRTGTSGVVDEDGSGVSLQDLRDRLVERLQALPEVSGASPAYRDLRRLFLESADFSREYALDVVKSWRRSLDKAPKPEPPKREPRPRRGRTPDSERKRASREQQQQDEEDSVHWFLEGWLAGHFTRGTHAGEPLRAGLRVPAPALRRKAEREISTVVEDREQTLSAEPERVENPNPDDYRLPDELEAYREAIAAYEDALRERGSLADRLADWESYAEEWGYPLRPRVPRRGVFFSTADEILGARRVYSGQQVYTVPDTTAGGSTMPSTITREEIAEALEVREIVEALRDHKRRHATKRDTGGRYAATGTDGAVIDLDSRRR